MSDYDTDFYTWTEQQAGLLRRRAAGEFVNEAELDWSNLAEEIESVGRSERHEVRNRLAVLLTHLLKWSYQPERRSGSWKGTIFEQRTQLGQLLEDSPSLRPFAVEALPKAFVLARMKAELQTSLLSLPAECPWTVDQVLSPEFWPD